MHLEVPRAFLQTTTNYLELNKARSGKIQIKEEKILMETKMFGKITELI